MQTENHTSQAGERTQIIGLRITERTIFAEDENGEEFTLPSKIEVCGRCGGRGAHDPRGFSGGFSSDDFAEDPDFSEDYFSGKYDVTCEECRGRNVQLVPDMDRMNEDHKSALMEYYRQESSYRAEQLAERRMGA